ncbi:transcriptional regulator GlxA family with amidase domain [Paraburkholderia graminis]|nr:transcriptional regulator GlxA family with amidase domain [Paraburkholderia graminis]MDR6473521.1 transcriptional regulator GlxA family with amidase domain [Paraburkholderia graminis]
MTDDFQVMAIGTQTVFEIANVVAREPIYHVTNYSLQGGEIRSSLGVSVMTRPADSNATADTWMISGVANPTGRTTTAEELRFISEAAARSRRTAGLCTGAFVLAEAGLLNGKRATTHWAFADALQARWPLVQVEADRIFIVDGPIWTSAGLTAAMDLALGLVEKDMGADFATRVARAMVMTHRRSGGQSQHSEMLALAPKSDRVQKALEHARLNLSKPLRVDDLAKAAHLSSRQFARIFLSETGISPAKAIERLRLEEARNLIERGRHSLETIARETGFRDRRHLREVFTRAYQITPQSLRRESRNVTGDDHPIDE